MDAKITKERLSRMLSYDWLKIVGLILAAILVWSLIFTTTATRITPAQQFTVINYFGNVSTNNTKLLSTSANALSEKVFSYEVIETTSVDVPGGGDYGNTLMEARVSTYEGDVIYVPNIEDEASSYEVEENGEKQTRYDTYLQRLVRTYGYMLYNLDPTAEDGYFKGMEAFLNRYYSEDGFETGVLNEEAIRRDFLARIERNKDKRFKKEAQIEAGVQDEIARIQKYRDALLEFYGYVESGLIEFTHTTVVDHSTNEVFREGVYSINLCPDKEKMGKLNEIAAYAKIYEGMDAPSMVAENMNVAFFNFKEMEESFQYENLLYVNYVIRLSKTDA